MLGRIFPPNNELGPYWNNMSTSDTFPPRPVPQLSLEDVIGYLSECRSKGWDVFRDDDHSTRFPIELTERFILWISEFVWIRVYYGNGKCGVFVHRKADEIPVGWPESLQGLDELVAYGAKSYGGIDWPSSPSVGRLKKSTPASNFSVLSGLVGSASIEAIYDPYLDDKALENLLTLINLGTKISQGCRFLSSPKGAARLSPGYVQAWLMETSRQVEIRKSTSRDSHRRFMLLSGGQTLILGLSINSLAKDEAAHLETNTVDRAFFDSEWGVSIAI